jgi:hypothetical protein
LVVSAVLQINCRRSDDRQAIGIAQEKADGRPAELWQQARMVRDFPVQSRKRAG